jgi:ABC-type enterochelin transport system substrate-binding protein
MKKITFALAACVVFAFAACGGNNTEGTTPTDSTADTTATAPEATADTTAVKADTTATAAPAEAPKAEKK